MFGFGKGAFAEYACAPENSLQANPDTQIAVKFLCLIAKRAISVGCRRVLCLFTA